MQVPTSSVPQTDRALLGYIDPFGSGTLETRLMYPRTSPQATGEKIKLFFLKPLMKLAARNQVAAFLSSRQIQNLDTAKNLLRNISKNPFRSVSEKELSAVLAEAALTKISVSGNFSTLIESHFKDPDNLEHALCKLLGPLYKTHQAAMNSFIQFVRNPSAPLSRRDGREVSKLLGELHKINQPAALQKVVNDYQEAYQQAYREAANNNGFRNESNRNQVNIACDELYDHLPSEAKECINAFEQFCSRPIISESNRDLLHQFLKVFSQEFSGLSRETITFLLPLVISLSDALDGGAWLKEIKIPEEIHPYENKMMGNLLFMIRNGSSYSPSAARALVGYLAVKSRIKALESELSRSEKLLTGATQQKSSRFEKQKISALMKRRMPTKKAQKTVLAYKGVWTSTAASVEAKYAELTRLKSLMINNESRVQLTYVVLEADLLSQSLPSIGRKSRSIATQIIQELGKDLASYNSAEVARRQKPEAVNLAAPASQSPNPATSSHSVRS